MKTNVLPNPFEVYGIMGDVSEMGISQHLYASLSRIFKGLFFSIIMGLPVGLMMATYPSINKFMSPLLYLTYPIPKLALLPIVFLLLGIGETSKITMIILIIIFQIIITTRDAGINIPQENYHILTSLGAGRWKKLYLITLPAILPELISVLRISIGTAVSVLFFTETYGTNKGMGFFIVDAWMRIAYKEMYAGILILSFMGLLLFIILDILEKKSCRWKLNLR